MFKYTSSPFIKQLFRYMYNLQTLYILDFHCKFMNDADMQKNGDVNVIYHFKI